MKRCCRCLEVLPVDSFPKDKSLYDGLNKECSNCVSSKQKNVRIRKKWKVLSHYSDGSMECECCHDNHFEFLTVDHINGDGKTHRKKVGDVYQWALNNDFPPGLRVLCMNCNLSFGIYGYCPHHSPGISAPPAMIALSGRLKKNRALAIKERLASGSSIRSIAIDMNVTRRTVRQIKNGRTWSDL